ncbi:MAG: hypothetical protein ACRD3T_01705 [Terriglobia bacterium]
MNFACLYMPDFLLQAGLRDEPGGFDQALALVDGSSSCLRVIAATRKACEAGVVLGMTQTQAAPLAGIRHRSRAQEDSTHAALLDCARSCSPRIEDTAADAVVVDLEGLEKLLGPPSRIATQLLHQAEGLGLMIHLALAANPDAAVLAARGFRGATMIPAGEEAQKLGELPVRVLNPQPETLDTLHRWGIYRLKELAGLPPLPLSERLGQEGMRLQELARGGYCRSLMIAREAEQLEEGWELEDPATTLDELDFVLSSVLLRLSKRLTIRSLATQEMRLRLDLVKGVEPEPGLALEEQRRETKGERRETRDEKRAMAPDSSLVSRLSPLGYERTLNFPSPMNDARLFFKLWRLRLESDLPPAPVARIKIMAQPARPRPIQGGLFAPLAPDPEKLELTLARIAAVVGSSNVGSPQLVDTHRPHAFRMAEFNPAEAGRAHNAMCASPRALIVIAAQAGTQAVDPCFRGGDGVGEPLVAPCSRNDGPSPKRRPEGPRQPRLEALPAPQITGRIAENEAPSTMALRLFRPPVPARLELDAGHPMRLFSSQVRGKIVFAAGPWRKSGGWWEEEKWDREEWDVEIRTGKTTALYSIYYDLARDEWYLQGEYD